MDDRRPDRAPGVVRRVVRAEVAERQPGNHVEMLIERSCTMQVQRLTAVFAVVAVMATIASASDKPPSNKNDEPEASASPSKPLIGIGAAIKPPQAKDGNQLIELGGEIFRLVPNSPAALCGELAVGDLIVAVAQGEDAPINCQGMEFSDVINLIRGPEGTKCG